MWGIAWRQSWSTILLGSKEITHFLVKFDGKSFHFQTSRVLTKTIQIVHSLLYIIYYPWKLGSWQYCEDVKCVQFRVYYFNCKVQTLFTRSQVLTYCRFGVAENFFAQSEFWIYCIQKKRLFMLFIRAVCRLAFLLCESRKARVLLICFLTAIKTEIKTMDGVCHYLLLAFFFYLKTVSFCSFSLVAPRVLINQGTIAYQWWYAYCLLSCWEH